MHFNYNVCNARKPTIARVVPKKGFRILHIFHETEYRFSVTSVIKSAKVSENLVFLPSRRYSWWRKTERLLPFGLFRGYLITNFIYEIKWISHRSLYLSFASQSVDMASLVNSLHSLQATLPCLRANLLELKIIPLAADKYFILLLKRINFWSGEQYADYHL